MLILNTSVRCDQRYWLNFMVKHWNILEKQPESKNTRIKEDFQTRTQTLTQTHKPL